MTKQIVGLYNTYEDADGAVDELMAQGYTKDDINLAAKEDTLASHKTTNGNGKVQGDMGEGTTSGAKAGAMVGGLAGLVMGIGALAVPGIGPLITLGTLSTAIGSTAVGAGVGAAGGGVIGGLLGLGLSDSEAAEYEKGLNEGSIVVAVDPKGNDQLVRDVFAQNNVVRVN